MKSAGRRGNIGPSAGLVILVDLLSIEGFNTLAQVTYIPKFIMADSEDEFMPIFIAASAAFVANNPKHLPAGRRPAGNIKHI